MRSDQSSTTLPLLQINDLCVGQRLSVAQLTIRAGSLYVILGSNGAGKSTLLATLAGMPTEFQGSVQFVGSPIQHWGVSELASRRSYLAQEITSQFALTVAELLRFYATTVVIPEAVDAALQISNFLDTPLSQLSGGELQRVQIARILLQHWSLLLHGDGVLLLDEPLQGLDIVFQLHVMELLAELQRTGNCIIMTCHDINLAYRYATHAMLLRKGEIVAEGQVDKVVTTANLAQCYECHFYLNYSENAYEFFTSALNSHARL
ncbi:ABC transporter ATP-binding protein [Alteromonas flava]|uniref:ABC transporter ATP-binding protein n=1 Tax=Alteromonas flava TaxID=2048003 RepID=UPI0013DABACD|nr:ABC transporter ATP-binding protein [Alteromonas flava]